MELRGEVARLARDARLVVDVVGINANQGRSWVDVGLNVSLQSSSFSGSSNTSVAADAVKRFADELAALDASRTGTAELRSMSPGEFHLTLLVTHPAGHVVAAGTIAVSKPGTDRRLTNSVAFEFEIDLACLHPFLHAIQDLSRRVAGVTA
jgi:hypothetical protein